MMETVDHEAQAMPERWRKVDEECEAGGVGRRGRRGGQDREEESVDNFCRYFVASSRRGDIRFIFSCRTERSEANFFWFHVSTRIMSSLGLAALHASAAASSTIIVPVSTSVAFVAVPPKLVSNELLFLAT